MSDGKTINVKQTIEEYMYQTDWRVKANANQSYSVGGMILNTVGKVVANYWLNEIYPKEAGEAHRSGDIHIHDLDFLGGYCCGHSLRALLQEGFAGVPGKTSAMPPKHFSAALGQMANFLGTMQNEWAGAQAFSSFDTLLAPFVAYDKLDYKQVKQEIQEFVYCCGTSSRWGGQTVFSNITLDLKCPEDLKDKPVLIGGVDTGTTYKDYQEQMDIINMAFLDVMSAGDKDGRPFTFPIPTYNVTNDWEWDTPVANKLFEVTAKYGYPYFSNYMSSDMKPSDVRSMCPLTGDTKVLVRSSKGVSVQDIYQIVNNMKPGRECSYQVWDGFKWCNAVPNKQPADKTVKVTMSNGDVVTMGKDHLQFVPKLGKSIHARELKEGMYLPYNSNQIPGVDLPARDNFGKLFKTIDGWNCYSIKSIEEGPVESLYCFDVDNESALFMLANGLMTHNCRLRLDLRELLKKGNGLFGSAEQTGSIGVVTLNMARLGYLHKGDFAGLKQRIKELCTIAKDSLEIKRQFLTDRLEAGFYPFTKRWIGTYRNFFSTIGVNGMNEMVLNYTDGLYDITTDYGQDMAEDILNFIRELMVEFQKETGHLYNLEATPAEGATTRFARADKKLFPDIIQAGTDEAPYYTNSSQIPVGYTSDIFTALDLQERLQTKYTGGTVLHLYMGQKISSGEACKQIVKRVLTNYSLPYISITPVYSICPKHGYIAGAHKYCPICEHEFEAERLINENK